MSGGRQASGLDLRAQPWPLPFTAPRHPPPCPPPCPQHRPGLVWAARTWPLLRVAERETAQRPGEQPNWQRDPTAPPSTPELVAGETLWDCRLLPKPRQPSPQSPDALSCWVPALGAALGSGLPPCKAGGTPVGGCCLPTCPSSAVLAVPNAATAPWQQERQARHKSFSETHSKSALR